MRYQVVLQLRGDSGADFDAIVALEDELYDSLSGLAEVDGHDIGSDEANIFVLTDDPQATFSEMQPVLTRLNLLTNCTVAHREVEGDSYTVLWPVNSTQAFRVV